MADVIGSIVAFAGPVENIPANWLLCDGRFFSKLIFPDLFAAIGTNWGGDGDPFFLLPDLRGQFLRGVDTDTSGASSSPAQDPDRDARAASNPAANVSHPGSSGNKVGSKQSYATARPTKPLITDDPGDHSHLDPTWAGGTGPFELAVGAARGPGNSDFIPPNNTSNAGRHTHTVTSGGDNETRPRNAYVCWIIKATN